MKGPLFAFAAAAALSATSLVESAAVGPQPRGFGEPLRIPLYTHSKRNMKDPEQTRQFANSQMDYVRGKWGNSTVKSETLAKRQTIGLTSVGQDLFYFGQVSIGTPAQNFNIILDTGSSDFWVVDSACTSSQCTGVNQFDSSSSSSFQGSSDPFSIRYGSGAVQGVLATDTVSLAGYSVTSQTFAEVDTLAQNTLRAPASGIMGMGFQQLASSQATPLWQVLAEQGKFRDNLFSFQLTRNAETTQNTAVNPGGVFTMGELDSNQFNGTPNYVSLSGSEGYWTIPLQAFNINGQQSTLTSGNTAAIDTGTSLVIAPPNVATAIYQQIPNAQVYDPSGLFAIPCNSNVDLRLSFGGTEYAINSADMTNGVVDTSGQYCLGGVLGQSLGGGAPDFIVGDTFLKNVFSVFRYDPPAVGFAALKGTSSQTAATTSGAVGSVAPATATPSTSSPETAAPPIITTGNTASATGVTGGSGLPEPVAASSNTPSTPTLIPAGQDSSTSGAGSIYAPTPLLAAFSALFVGFLAVL